ncbi:ATP-dependent RNA helicase DeaD [Catalinimonas alkaloidigena]|uniref:DEAD-box ATP-dependent RNA helicase RhpA n=1 Tax=Catalinimonas alkaloidigena TaxID=1075417 RepID=A0A1G9RJQ1_9BACT|nr:DEAD/DEAH box helicase [Catalinimonas alkaloidigena]SDM23522.1 ATP-dependent RNA helicase DeaD [Catalinimonas alkaloidigena]
MQETLLFSELPLSPEVLQAVTDMGFEQPTPIQAQSIPVLLEGRDFTGQAQTGTGKTASFGIPAIERVDTNDRSVQVIILCPTRELAQQVTEEMRKLSKHKAGLNLTTLYGGASYDPQIRDLKRGVQIVVGTPGRVIDHLNRGTLKLDNVRYLVLDEADEMLNMGFRDDMEEIIQHTSEARQTVFFSATMPPEILDLTRRYQHDPVMVRITRKELTTDTIEQKFFEVRGGAKLEAFSRLTHYYNIQLSLVFCNTKAQVDELVTQLQAKGFDAEALHGDLKQAQRNHVMGRFRKGIVNILVATDVAARGIDVDDIEAVFNYDVPLDEEAYVHRIGRTGRAGKTGLAITFVTGRDFGRLKGIMRYTKANIERGELPSIEELVAVKKQRFAETLKQTIDANPPTDEFDDLIDDLAEAGYPARDVIAALINMNMGNIADSFENVRFEDAPRERGASSRQQRNERTSGRRNRPARAQSDDAHMTRLFFNVGRRANVRPQDIVGAIAGETHLRGNQIGAIDIYDSFTFVDVPNDHASSVIETMSRSQIRGMRINVEVAR